MPEPGKPGPEPARYGDDGGLHLVVAPAGGKSWVFRAVAPAVPTFQAAAESMIAIDKPTWDDARPEAQWRSSLANCAHPKLNALSVPSGAFGNG